MTTTSYNTPVRYFGRCVLPGCKHRDVRMMSVNEMVVAVNEVRCPTHSLPTKWSALDGKLNLEKACTSRCMASTGPSCSCSCGGENHGTNHL